MRIDPTSVFVHTIASLPLRVVLAWIVATLGAFTPLLIKEGFEAIEYAYWQFLFFPFYLLFITLFSGWWSFVAAPLLIALVWHSVEFLKGDGYLDELILIYLLSFLIGIRASEDRWPYAALLSLAIIIFMTRRSRTARVHHAGGQFKE